jgi:hypothetical protein
MSATLQGLIMAMAMALTSEQAIGIARSAFPDGGAMDAVASIVQRLDRPGSAYYLVVLSRDNRPQGVVTIDRATGRVGSSARLQEGGSPLKVDAPRARQLAGADEAAEAELVWAPSRASRSPLYPFWRVQAGPRWRYVNQQEQVFDSLNAPGPGGGPR